MVVTISYYPDSVAGAFGKPKDTKGIAHLHYSTLQDLVTKLTMLDNAFQTSQDKKSVITFKDTRGQVDVYDKPFHISLRADSPKELSDLAFELSQQFSNAGFEHYSFPFDYSQIEEVK